MITIRIYNVNRFWGLHRLRSIVIAKEVSRYRLEAAVEWLCVSSIRPAPHPVQSKDKTASRPSFLCGISECSADAPRYGDRSYFQLRFRAGEWRVESRWLPNPTLRHLHSAD